MPRMSEQQQRAIIDKDSAWLDDNFSPVCRSAPAPQPPPCDETKCHSIAHQFMQACPGYMPTEGNYDTLAKTLAFNVWPASQQNGTTDEIVADLISGGFWTVPNLIACYRALHHDDLLDAPHESNIAERVRIARVAQVRRTDEAIRQYLRCVINAAVLALLERLHRSREDRQCY